jgi:hypothetical protein
MSTEQNLPVDAQTMDMDELRQLVEQADAQGVPLVQDEPNPDAQPRDENGRFASKKAEDDAAEAEAAESAAAPQVDPPSADDGSVEIEIDLGEGAGKEIFRASNREELLELLVESKKHASKKIREQAEELRKLKVVTEEPTVSADEEFVYSQELMTNPTVAFKKLVEKSFGLPFADVKAALSASQQMTEKDRRNTVMQNFLTTHPEYEDSVKNAKLFQKWMGNEFTTESFEKAYLDLKESGLLEVKAEEAHTGQEEPKAAATRIADKAEDKVPPQRTPIRTGSGISTRGRAPVPVKTKSPEEEARSMSEDELRLLAMKAWQ